MSTKGGLKRIGLNLEGRSWFEEERRGMNAEDGMVVEEHHLHENWNAKQLALSLIDKAWCLQKNIILSSSSGEAMSPLSTIDYKGFSFLFLRSVFFA